jgi:hypothetical protein
MPLTDEQLRRTLAALPADVDVAGDLGRVRARTAVHRRRRRTVMALVSLVAVVAIAVVASFVVRDEVPARRSVVAEPAPTSAPSATTTLLPLDVARIPPSAITAFSVPEGGGATLALGAGSVWVGGTAPAIPRCTVGCGRVTRIDAESGDAVATIVVPKYPRSFAYGFDALWAEAEAPDNSPALVVKIDPATNQVVAQIELPGTAIVGSTGHPRIAVGAEAVWMQYGNQLTKIDPASGAVVGQAQVDTWGSGGVVADDAGVWVVGSGGGVAAIDPGTMEVRPLASLPSGFIQSSTVDGDSIWLTEAHGDAGRDPVIELIRVDTTTGGVTFTGIATTNVAAGDGQLWFQGFAGLMLGDTHADDVVQLDPATARPLRAANVGYDPLHPPVMAVDRTAVWTLSGAGLVRIRG